MQETELSGGLYTRLVLHDFLPEYPGRATFVPGLSEYGATKPWLGSPMAAIQRAVIMMRKLNLVGIPRDIIKDLRALQDIYSAPIDLDAASDSDGGTDAEVGRDAGKHPEAEPDQGETLSHSTGGSKDIPTVHQIGSLERLTDDTNCKDEAETSQPAIQRPQPSSPSSPVRTQSTPFWRWGPSATSQDAMKFFRAVI
jgi:hypothetical protein